MLDPLTIVQTEAQPAQNLWERYLTGPESSPDASTYRTELNRPLL